PDNTTSFTVTPNGGYNIANVTGCAGSLSGNTYTTGAINAACTVSATFADTTPPTISATTPANSVIGVELNIAPTVTFSEDMLGTSIDSNTVLLEGAAPVTATVSFNGYKKATLTPNAALNWFTSYVVKVTTAVADLSGNPLASETSWGFTTRAPLWQTSQLLENNTGDATSLQSTADASGNVLAVWTQQDGTDNSIWSNRYTPSGGWGIAELIESNAGYANSPQTAFDASGNAIAVWAQHDGTDNSIWSNSYTPSGGWGIAELIESDAGHASIPQIAFDTSGNAMAVWAHVDSSGDDKYIRSNRYTTSGGWGTAELIGSSIWRVGHPQIAFDTSGNAIAVWEHSEGTYFNIWSNRYTPSGGWGTAAKIESSTEYSLNAQITFDASGNALAVWRQQGTYDNIWSNRYTPSGGWGITELIESNTGDASIPQFAFDASGNALAVWSQRWAEGYALSSYLWSNRYTPSGGWSTAKQLFGSDGKGGSPQVSIDSKNNALLVWAGERQRSGHSLPAHLSSYFTPALGWSSVQALETGDPQTGRPQMSADASGNAIVVWHQHEDGYWNIWANQLK
ncbi:MAG: Ig-like domain-containing protein, partial [Pseudomonadales bacterium]|nr:Ig-like domain-containing protein [Pseudomonadales bacterium]